MSENGIYQSPRQKNIAATRARLQEICQRVESGEETTTAERYFYCSLVYFQERDGNDGAINEFLNVAQAAGLF